MPTIGDYIGAPASETLFQSVVADVTGLFVTGDLISGNDRSTLDKVVVESVPEPATGLLTGAALGALLFAASRLRRT